jgi:hypothetical protein
MVDSYRGKISLVAEVGNYDNLPSDLRDALLKDPSMSLPEAVKIINEWGNKDAIERRIASREAMSRCRIRYKS